MDASVKATFDKLSRDLASLRSKHQETSEKIARAESLLKGLVEFYGNGSEVPSTQVATPKPNEATLGLSEAIVKSVSEASRPLTGGEIAMHLKNTFGFEDAGKTPLNRKVASAASILARQGRLVHTGEGYTLPARQNETPGESEELLHKQEETANA